MRGLITHPLVRADGRLVSEPGLDEGLRAKDPTPTCGTLAERCPGALGKNGALALGFFREHLRRWLPVSDKVARLRATKAKVSQPGA